MDSCNVITIAYICQEPRTIAVCHIWKKNLNGNNCDTLAGYIVVNKSQTFRTLHWLFVCRGKRKLKPTLNVWIEIADL